MISTDSYFIYFNMCILNLNFLYCFIVTIKTYMKIDSSVIEAIHHLFLKRIDEMTKEIKFIIFIWIQYLFTSFSLSSKYNFSKTKLNIADI